MPPVEAFWTIVAYAVVLGIGAWVECIFFYWFVVMPRRDAPRSLVNRR
jgi:hypothetical protein